MYAPYLLFRLAYPLSRHFSRQRLLPPCAHKLTPFNTPLAPDSLRDAVTHLTQ
jgi:hypothetical protein